MHSLEQKRNWKMKNLRAKELAKSLNCNSEVTAKWKEVNIMSKDIKILYYNEDNSKIIRSEPK